MPIDQPLLDTVEWAANFAFWSALLFPLVIIPVWPWWKDWYGQTMVAFDLVFAGAAGGLVLRYDWGVRGTALAWVNAVFLGLTFVVLAWRTVAIYLVQRKDR